MNLSEKHSKKPFLTLPLSESGFQMLMDLQVSCHQHLNFCNKKFLMDYNLASLFGEINIPRSYYVELLSWSNYCKFV